MHCNCHLSKILPRVSIANNRLRKHFEALPTPHIPSPKCQTVKSPNVWWSSFWPLGRTEIQDSSQALWLPSTQDNSCKHADLYLSHGRCLPCPFRLHPNREIATNGQDSDAWQWSIHNTYEHDRCVSYHDQHILFLRSLRDTWYIHIFFHMSQIYIYIHTYTIYFYTYHICIYIYMCIYTHMLSAPPGPTFFEHKTTFICKAYLPVWINKSV